MTDTDSPIRPDRAPGVAWLLRPEPARSYVTTIAGDLILVVLPAHPDTDQLISFRISRKDARLLAKRLNQCLDDTTLT